MWCTGRMAAISTACLIVFGCASAQLNFNALDLAASSDDLITSQVLYNLGKFRSSPYAIPSQVTVPSGSATTTNNVTPTVGGPFSPSLTATVANSAAAPLFFSSTKTRLTPNGTVSASVGDQWSQNWALSPVEDPDELRRLRAIYRFGAGLTDKSGLACEYPLVQKQKGSGNATSTAQTVNVYVNGNRVTSQESKPPEHTPGAGTTNYSVPECPSADKKVGEPDAAFLAPPGCILCDYHPQSTPHTLIVNHRLSNRWLWNPSVPFPADAKSLGHYAAQDLYLIPTDSPACSHDGLGPHECAEREFGDFVLLVLDAMRQSTAAAGAAKPTTVQQPAHSEFMLE